MVRRERILMLDAYVWDNQVGCILMKNQPDVEKETFGWRTRTPSWSEQILELPCRIFLSWTRPSSSWILTLKWKDLHSVQIKNLQQPFKPYRFLQTAGQVETPLIIISLRCSTLSKHYKPSLRRITTSWNRAMDKTLLENDISELMMSLDEHKDFSDNRQVCNPSDKYFV